MKESPPHAGEWCTDVDDRGCMDFIYLFSSYELHFGFCSEGFLVAAVLDQVIG